MAGNVEHGGGNARNLKDIAKAGATLTLGLAAGHLAGRTLIEARQHRRTQRARAGLTGDSDRITDRTNQYYAESPSYLTGPLQGTCHFGYTEIGTPFDLPTALHGMEVQLAEAIGLPPGATVVDAGCGFGRVAKTMAEEFGYNVYGVDLSPERVEEARRFTQMHGVADRVTIEQGDYSRLPLPDNSVDAIYTMETLCHAPDLDATLAEFYRVLRPGGRLVHFEYSYPRPESLGRLHTRVANTMMDNMGMDSMAKFTHGAFPSLIEPAGFENVTVRDATENVLPTWHFLFKHAIKENRTSIIPKILAGSLTDIPNLAGSLILWPYRKNLGYNIITANKPAATHH